MNVPWIAWACLFAIAAVSYFLARRWARQMDEVQQAIQDRRPVRPRNKPVEPHFIDIHQTLLDTDPVYAEIDAARQQQAISDGWWYANGIWYDATTQSFSPKRVSS